MNLRLESMMEVGLGELKPSNIAFQDPLMSKNPKDFQTHSQWSPNVIYFVLRINRAERVSFVVLQ